jgi:signal transduction histidine kinase
MQDRVQKMDALLNDLLEYSRVGRIEQQAVTVDLQEMVQSIIDMCDNPHGASIQIVTPLPTIRTAITPLKQVILNLVTNAIKYNDKADQGLIQIGCEDSENELYLWVSDNGRGIEPRYRDRVFQMYQRIAPQEIEGSGMGLAIVKKQVEYHGGQVTLESEVGAGCRFAFTWAKEDPESSGQMASDSDRTDLIASGDAGGGAGSVELVDAIGGA